MKNKTPDKSWTKKDFNIQWFSGKGAGGQHRNKHQNCCRITHIESGLTSIGQNHKERKRNQADAMYDLAQKIVLWYYGENQKERSPATDVVRTYNIPDNKVYEHTSGEKYNWKNFDIDEAIMDRKKYEN